MNIQDAPLEQHCVNIAMEILWISPSIEVRTVVVASRAESTKYVDFKRHGITKKENAVKRILYFFLLLLLFIWYPVSLTTLDLSLLSRFKIQQ